MNKLEGTLSRIARRTRGQSHGPVTRLMSPSDFGRLLKPFVFLDLFDNQGKSFSGFGLHPHSGIATLTYVAEGSVSYEDTNGATGLLPAGGLEWMRAGGGVWQGGGAGESGRAALGPDSGVIEVVSDYDAEFVLGSAVPHDYDLVLGSHSVHTSTEALREAEARISEIQTRLIQQGKL